MEVLPPYDGSMPIDEWKAKRARDLKFLQARKSSLLKAKDAAGYPLYKVNDGGNIVRTKPLSKTTKRQVIERDKACVSCGAGAPFEVTCRPSAFLATKAKAAGNGLVQR